jgi:hypothetical protein
LHDPDRFKKYGLHQKMTLKISNFKGILNGMQGNQRFVHFYLKEKPPRQQIAGGVNVAFRHPSKFTCKNGPESFWQGH